jgi:uncharacterized metal-binding protein YceD (DUF177 family)
MTFHGIECSVELAFAAAAPVAANVSASPFLSSSRAVCAPSPRFRRARALMTPLAHIAPTASLDKFELQGDDVEFDPATMMPASSLSTADDDAVFADESARSESVAYGLHLDRRDLEPEAGVRGRTVRLCRQSTLGEANAVEYGSSDTPVAVRLAVQPIRGDFRVIGRVETDVTRVCDRCVEPYTSAAKGSFEVWLTTTEEGLSPSEERELEAVEPFCGARARVDLAPHVHDAICLCLPTRAICGDDCSGLAFPSSGLLDKNGTLGIVDDKIVAPASADVVESIDASADEAATADMLLLFQQKFENDRRRGK